MNFLMEELKRDEKGASEWSGAPIMMEGCVSGGTAGHTVFTRCSSPLASCGRRSCSGVEPCAVATKNGFRTIGNTEIRGNRGRSTL